MKIPTPVLIIFAAVCWLSAIVIFVIGTVRADLAIWRWMALPDALLAAGLTYVVIQRWTEK